MKLYENENITFLLSECDTVQFYENKNKEIAKETQYEQGLKALSSLDRVKQVEAIEGKVNLIVISVLIVVLDMVRFIKNT